MNQMDPELFRLSDRDFKRFSELVYTYAGINLHEGKKELLQARIGKILRHRQLQSFSEYFEIVTKDLTGMELVHLLDVVSTNMTFFFREEKHFRYLSEQWLSQYLSTQRRQGLNKIRGWSAGCSTGEETYSIAISLLEKLGAQSLYDIKILGTDLSTRVLQVALAGLYPEERARNIPADLRNKYFDKVMKDDELYFQVKSLLTNRVLFRRLNLMEAFPFKNPLNFIFCRNVMIYFDRPTQQKLVKNFFDALASGGYFFIGHSESLNSIQHSFRYVAPSIYQKP